MRLTPESKRAGKKPQRQPSPGVQQVFLNSLQQNKSVKQLCLHLFVQIFFCIRFLYTFFCTRCFSVRVGFLYTLLSFRGG